MSTFRVLNPPAIDVQQIRGELEAATGLTVESGVLERGSLVVSFVVERDDLTGSDEIQEIVEATVHAHKPDEIQQLDQLIEKARQVWSGQGSFTQAQAQKILAGLVLLENRRR